MGLRPLQLIFRSDVEEFWILCYKQSLPDHAFEVLEDPNAKRNADGRSLAREISQGTTVSAGN